MPEGNYSSFILRLWVEPSGDWRWGLIQHVATRKKRRFSTVPEMLDFISEYAAVGEVTIPFPLDGTEGQAGPGDSVEEKALSEAEQRPPAPSLHSRAVSGRRSSPPPKDAKSGPDKVNIDTTNGKP